MRFRALAAVAATVVSLGGVSLATAGTAHAASCRAEITLPGATQMTACGFASSDNNIHPVVHVDGSFSVDPCAQLLKVNPSTGATTQIHDFGCEGWKAAGYNNDNSFAEEQSGYHVGKGVYVVQYGFWTTFDGGEALTYYGGVQSPRIYITNAQ